MSFLANIEWRRAVKSFQSAKTSETEPDIEPILQAAINAPSSFGLQPWKIIVVSHHALKEKLAPVMYNQPQVTQCSHLLIFCGRTDLDERITEYVQKTHTSPEMESMIRGFVAGQSHQAHWAKHQAYLALGFALAAATELKIASCPMEGFSIDGVSSVLNLPPELVPAAVMAVGHEDTTQQLYPRFRFDRNELVYEMPHIIDITIKSQSKYRSVTPMRRKKTT